MAAYTIELGTAFFQSCPIFESTVLPANMPALLLAAKMVRTPYLTPAGPDALSVTASPATVTLGGPATLTATIDDTRYNNTNGTEPTQNIAAAEYYIDTPPWQKGAVAYAMTASDGNFNSTIENVTATVSTAGLAAGKHILLVRGKDAAGNWGAFSAAFLNVTIMSTTPASQAVCAPDSASYTVNVGYTGSVTLERDRQPCRHDRNLRTEPGRRPRRQHVDHREHGRGRRGQLHHRRDRRRGQRDRDQYRAA